MYFLIFGACPCRVVPFSVVVCCEFSDRYQHGNTCVNVTLQHELQGGGQCVKTAVHVLHVS